MKIVDTAGLSQDCSAQGVVEAIYPMTSSQTSHWRLYLVLNTRNNIGVAHKSSDRPSCHGCMNGVGDRILLGLDSLVCVSSFFSAL